jgi:hypothetical protein
MHFTILLQLTVKKNIKLVKDRSGRRKKTTKASLFDIRLYQPSLSRFQQDAIVLTLHRLSLNVKKCNKI